LNYGQTQKKHLTHDYIAEKRKYFILGLVGGVCYDDVIKQHVQNEV
jgi:hypothetical protein